MKIDRIKVAAAILFMFFAFLLMQYYTYLNKLGLSKFTAPIIGGISVRKSFHFGFFVVFAILLILSARGNKQWKVWLFVIAVSFAFSIFDETRDYICAIRPSILDIMADMAGTITSLICFTLYKTIYIKLNPYDT